MQVEGGRQARRSGIFVSYRRDDTSGYAGRLYDRLSEHFGDDQVFMDIDEIDPGLDFGEVIDQAVGSCRVLIALIGNEWLSASDDRGRRRLQVTGDFVRMEIGRALRRDVLVIPVLVQGARMPAKEDLPSDLAALARRNAIELSDSRWQFDVGRLLEVLNRALAQPDEVTTDPVAPRPVPAEPIASKPAPPKPAPAEPVKRPQRVAAQASVRKFPLPLAWSLAVGAAAAVTAGILIWGSGDDSLDDDTDEAAVISTDVFGDLGDSRIAFVSDQTGTCQIHVINADGTGEDQITDNGGHNFRPDWSPAGDRLVYANENDGSSALLIVDVDDRRETRLLDHPGRERGPDWSPAEQIVFSSILDGWSQIWVVDATGAGEAQQLTDDEARNVAPDWSPEGDKIVFASNRDGSYDIHIMNADGMDRVNLTSGMPGSEYDPQWSPDGRRITFDAQPKGEDYDIWAMNPDGTDAENVTADSRNDRHSSWSPDSRAIVFGSDREVDEGDAEPGCSPDEGQQDLFLMTSEGTDQTRLTRIEADDSIPAWAP